MVTTTMLAPPGGRADDRASPPWAGSWLRGKRLIPVLALAGSLLFGGASIADGLPSIPDGSPIPDASGAFATTSTAGVIDTANPFFQSLGSNGRSCVTCHTPTEAWSITPQDVQLRFLATGGTEPIFRPVDGANSPLADVSTVDARRQAYSMPLGRAVIRVDLTIPGGAEFALTAVDDPYRYITLTPGAPRHLSLFRRPLPAANLRFLSAVMWDGRETVQPLLPANSAAQNLAALQADLMHQANDATLGHAQAGLALTPDQQQQIMAFELGLSVAQVADNAAGSLSAAGAQGGPGPLAAQPFHIGINDVLGGDPSGGAFNPVAFSLSGPRAGQTIRTTDPGRAMISGKCADIGKFKGPILRALAARAPYFHNGAAATLNDVVTFYNARFTLHLSAQEQADVVAFLRAL